ncbi:MAG: hypothetical protein OEZ06_00640 [Myxococcales bacterium]|nr:hypothetical protein [Myxococcales bacterium]
MTIRHAITGGRIAAVAAGLLVLVGLGATLPERIGRAEAYKQAAAASRLLEREQLGDFFACTLVDARPSKLDAAGVRTRFARMGGLLGGAFAPVLRSCGPRMDALVAGVQALQVPTKLSPHHAAMVAAVDALRTATARYQKYLAGLDGAYDAAVAAPMLDSLGQALSAYQAATRGLQRALGQAPGPAD